ncbi:TPA: hypothetical protein ACKRL0_000492 [Proteus mirabilis]
MFSSNIDDNEIKKRIENFRSNIEKGVLQDNIIPELTSIFGDLYSCPTEMGCYEIGTTFYRVRPIPLDDTIIPLKTIGKIEDAWEPPTGFIKVQGRLNNVNESILYCCPNDFELAIDEARARNNKYVAVIVYKSSRPIWYSMLGNYENSRLPKDDKTKLFYSFLNDEFSIIVNSGEENRYSITRAIATTFFNLPNQDAWCYRSVQSSEKFNVAFLPGKSKDCIELVGVMICTPSSSADGTLKVFYVVDFDEESGVARYHSLGSEKQKELFPEIQHNGN